MLRNNQYRAGLVDGLRILTLEQSHFGAGALEVWDSGDNVPTNSPTLADNDFEMSKGCGDRALVEIGACTSVSIRGLNRFVAGALPAALELEPATKSHPEGSTVGMLSIDRKTVLKGPIRWRGTQVSLEELSAKFPASKSSTH